jgi:tetratricopeptide (TPR) repeat protein
MTNLDDLEDLLRRGEEGEAYKLIRADRGISTQILINEGIFYDIGEEYNLSISYLDLAEKIAENDGIKEKIRKILAIVYNNRGLAYVKLNKFKEAIEDFKKGLELNPGNSEPYIICAHAYGKLNQYEDEIECFNKLIGLNPNTATFYNDRGLVYFKLRRYEEALKDYNKAIIFNPNIAGVYLNRGLCYYKLKQYEDAISAYNKAVELNPNYADAYYNRGLTYDELKQYGDAISDHNKAIELNPTDAEYYYDRGLTYLKCKQYRDAIEDFKKAIEINPNNYESYISRGQAYFKLGQRKEAIEDFENAIELSPNDARAYSNRGAVNVELKHYDEAIKDLNKAIKLDPNLAVPYFNRGVYCVETNDNLDKAIENFKNARNLSVEIDKERMLGFIEWAKARDMLNKKNWEAYRERMDEARAIFEKTNDPISLSFATSIKFSYLDEKLDDAFKLSDPIRALEEIANTLKNSFEVKGLIEPEKTIFHARIRSFDIIRELLSSIKDVDENTDLEKLKEKLSKLFEASKDVEKEFESVNFMKGKTAIVNVQEIISLVKEEIGNIEWVANTNKTQKALDILLKYWSRLAPAIKMMNGISTCETENIVIGNKMEEIRREMSRGFGRTSKEIGRLRREHRAILKTIYETKNVLIQKDVVNARYRLEFPPSPSPAKIIVDIPMGNLTEEQIKVKVEEITDRIKILRGKVRKEFLEALNHIPESGKTLFQRLKKIKVE